MARDIRTLKSILNKFGRDLKGKTMRNGETRYAIGSKKSNIFSSYTYTAEDVEDWIDERLDYQFPKEEKKPEGYTPMGKSIREMRSILNKFGYILKTVHIGGNTCYSIFDRRELTWCALYYQVSAEEVEQFVYGGKLPIEHLEQEPCNVW